MVDKRFEQSNKCMPQYYSSLWECTLTKVANPKMPKNIPGIYAFWDKGEPVYCGRSRDIRNRIQQHVRKSTYGATFAVKKARLAANCPPTYKKGNSAPKLLKSNEEFESCYYQALEDIKEMEFRWVEIENDVDQYLFEVFATLKLGLPSELFRSH